MIAASMRLRPMRVTSISKGSEMFEPYLEEIANAYDALPAIELDALPWNVVRAWEALADDSQWRAQKIARDVLKVDVTDDSEPYEDAVAMVRDIAGGHFVVSRANCDHPVWSVNENIAFRIVHDVSGHYAASYVPPYDAPIWSNDVAGFDWAGENRACAVHFPLLPVVARHALFVECIAQTGYACARGEFGPQKVGLIVPRIDRKLGDGYGLTLAMREVQAEAYSA